MLPGFGGALWDFSGSEHSSALDGFCNLRQLLKCPYYGFLKITCHAVCNTALSE